MDASATRNPLLGALATVRTAILAPLRRSHGASKWMLVVGAGILAVIIVTALFADLIAPYSFDQYTDSEGARFPKLAPPSAEHLFGTTVRQTDLFSVIVFGARTALIVVVLSLVLSIAIGVPLGLISGYRGGRLDRFLMLVADAMLAFPSLLLAITISFALSAAAGGGMITAALAITVVYVPQYFRIVRNSVMSLKQETYVEAAATLGLPTARIATRYLLPNVMRSIPVLATLNAADAILTLAGLGFLGYGVQPNEAAEWGYELQRALPDVSSGLWWTTLFPGLSIMLLVTSLTLFGEGINDIYSPDARPTARRRSRRAMARKAVS